MTQAKFCHRCKELTISEYLDNGYCLECIDKMEYPEDYPLD